LKSSPRIRLEVSVQNRQKRIRLSSSKVAGWTRKILRALRWKRAGLSLALVDDTEIRSLHRKYLGEDTPTDVMAFEPAKKFDAPKGLPFLGDVVVSVEMARRRAPQFGHSWDKELLLYVCHGILHLMGERDSTKKGKIRMEAKQEKVLTQLLGDRWPFRKQKLLF